MRSSRMISGPRHARGGARQPGGCVRSFVFGDAKVVGGVNLLRRKQVDYVTYFRFAGGLDPGSVVRFVGRKVGTVQSADFDPQDTTRIIVRLRVLANTPVRTDST